MSNQGQLRQLLTTFFSDSELQNLAFDLGLDYELLPGATRGDKARELVLHMGRIGRLPDLVGAARSLRPHVTWPELDLAQPPAPSSPAPRPERPAAGGGNPFTYGNPISDPARFFGRQREIEQVFNRLRNAEAESSSIVGGRRIGKSSLLNILTHPDVHRRYGMDPARVIFVYADLQMVNPQTTPARLWQYLLTQLERVCRQTEIAQTLRRILTAGDFDTFTLADLFEEVDRQGRHVVLVLDEFENVTTNPNFDPSFFYGLRSLAIQHNLSLVTSSRHELIELTHSQAIRSSPFFNIFANINVRLFDEIDSQQLLAASLANTGISFTKEELTTIDEIAGGHPFFLQAAGYFLFAAYGTEADAGNRRQKWLGDFSREVAPHLAHYWQAAEVEEQITLLLLALLEQRPEAESLAADLTQLESLYPRTGQILERLKRLGYVTERTGRYALFSSAFGGWILNELRSGAYARGDADRDEALVSLSVDESRRTAGAVSPGYRPLLAAWKGATDHFTEVMQLLLVESS